MIRSVLLLLAVLLATVPLARAQSPAAPGAEAAQARAALEVLQDEHKRAELIRVLQGIARAAPAGSPAPAAAPAPAPAKPDALAVVPLEPDSLGAQLLAGASDRLTQMSAEVVSVVRSATDIQMVVYWFELVATDRATQMLLLDVGWRLALALALALAAHGLTGRLLRRPMATLARHAPSLRAAEGEGGLAAAESGETEKLPRLRPAVLALVRRAPYAAGGLMVELLGVLALLAAGYASLGAGLATAFAPRYIILGVLHAVALYHAVMALARALLGARDRRLSLFVLPPASAARALASLRRIVALAIYGVTFAETAVLFGMYALAHDTFLKILALLVTLMVCAAVLRHRAGIAGLIRAVPVGSALAATMRERMAETWHLVACLYLLSLWLVWALELPNGFSRLLRVSVVTTLILVAARLAGNVLVASLRRALEPEAVDDGAATGIAEWLRGYHALLFRLGRVAAWTLASIALLEAWGVPALEWFAADRLGGRLLGALSSVGVTAAVALVTWEAANLAIQRHLVQLAADHQAARSARLRTLLPVLRTALLVAICLVTGLMALSEIGVNIAPLLAGAGVVGVAIGFGSQKLVQDIITGLFLLLENAMQVGDAVTLGGLSGTVENLSIRTIRLRALDGAVHIIPFSAVTTVTNMTRDFGYAVIDVRVGLNEPPDAIGALLREIAAGLRADPAWAAMITGDLDVMGVDGFNLQSYTLRARMRTTAGARWAVVREMNRRIKNLFDARGIESPMTSYRALGLLPPPPPMPSPSDDAA